ncbi:CHAD domain-containing protein [uncultured Draconibacterium sp.]|uniref:CHAD domain-containing protein n=1 Tax=uncultured Draconibacterium sp. TaxID=1573823 RepID=UPI0025EBEFD3|nr:CHAD domain-containing protein [uncultured Draconibacterium sp.]
MMNEHFVLEIQEQEYFEEGIFRVLDKLHLDAAKFITAKTQQHHNIHELRTNIKKIRGILRLLRHEIGEDSYQLMNSHYKNLAAEVAVLRDDTSQIELLQEIKNRIKDTAVKKDLGIIIAQHDDTRKQAFYLFNQSGNAENLKQMILGLQQMMHELSLSGNPELFILKSLKHIYRQARSAFEITGLLNDEELYHYWRKQVKYLMYHLMLLNKAWPNSIRVFINDLGRLASKLGELHDLNLFHTGIKEKRIYCSAKTQQSYLLRFVYKRRWQLKKHIHSLGEQCFTESSDAFAMRIFNSWENSVMSKKTIKNRKNADGSCNCTY